jgi:uncharacterized protein (DUF58 family)
VAIDRAVLAKLATLELKARYIVEGFVTGMHRSPFKGFSVEFAQHRGYVPGDDLKHLDWKVWGRNGRYVVKQYEAETNLVAHILVDGSKSMLYAGSEAFQGMSKLDYAKLSAAALAHLIIEQSDAAALGLFGAGLTEYVNRSSSKAHVPRLIATLEKWKPAPTTRIAQSLADFATRTRRKGIVFVISDLFDDRAEVTKALRRLRHDGHEVVVLHVMDHDELDFPFDGMVRFEGLEGTSEALCHPRSVRATYLKEVESFLTHTEATCRGSGIDYYRLDTRTAVDVGLSAYLLKREHMAASGAGGSAPR